MKVTFNGWECDVIFDNYTDNNRTAIVLRDSNDGDTVAIATVNIPEEDLEEDEVIIKDWSENEGIEEVLIEAGIIDEPERFGNSGHVTYSICKLLRRE